MRRSGKTTRLIDNTIQKLFTQGMVVIGEAYIKDADAQEHNTAQEDFVKRLLRRLEMEHDGYFEVEKRTHKKKPFKITATNQLH